MRHNHVIARIPACNNCSYVNVSMDALDKLLVTCHAQALNLFVESYLKMVQKLLECNETDLQCLATSSVCTIRFMLCFKYSLCELFMWVVKLLRVTVSICNTLHDVCLSQSRIAALSVFFLQHFRIRRIYSIKEPCLSVTQSHPNKREETHRLIGMYCESGSSKDGHRQIKIILL